MKKLFFLFAFFLLPSLVSADIAGPVLTKDQACEQKDGPSTNRLQIFINGEKSDTLYFYKQGEKLYYIVPHFPYSVKDSGMTRTYYSSLFLYQYDCKGKKSTLLSTQNLKKLLTKSTVSTPGSPFTYSDVKLFNYGQVTGISDSRVFFLLGITRTGVLGGYAFDLRTGQIENQIYLGSGWRISNSQDYYVTYGSQDHWYGVNVFYKDKKVYRFATCKGWGTKKQTDIDDFCGSTIQIISTSKDGIIMNITYDYPGAPLESGKYIMKSDGTFTKL